METLNVQYINESDLLKFTRASQFHKVESDQRDLVWITDGIKFINNNCNSYSILNDILNNQIHLKRKDNNKLRLNDYQLWTLTKTPDQNSAFLVCKDYFDQIQFEMNILYIDFPLNELNILFINNKFMLLLNES